LITTLYWETLQVTNEAYVVQLRLLDESESVVATLEEALPSGGQTAGSQRSGESYTSTHAMPLDPSLAGRQYVVQLALQERASERRLNLIGEDGRWLDTRLYLARIRIAGE
jgi:hypothetical protein